MTDWRDRFEELARAYESVAMPHSFWQGWQGKISLEGFRAHEQYVGSVGYDFENTTRFVQTIDRLHLLDCLVEDDAFGCETAVVNGLTVSRDLLDSILEIYFLLDLLPALPTMRVVDIGAGYGRLAHRLTRAFPEIKVYSTDGVAVSTACAERYLQYRGVDPIRAPVVPLHELDRIGELDLAINVHSWSECTASAVEYWLNFICSRKTPYVFVIPHTGAFHTDDHQSFRAMIEGSYELVAKREGHPPFQVIPSVPSGRGYYLFKRRAA